MGIVHHATYLVYFEAGRVEWLRRRGVAYADFKDRGVDLPVVGAQVQYRAPSRFDDVLTIETTLARLRTVSLDFTYRILRDETLVAEGSTRLACIDKSHKLYRLPPDLCAILLAGESVEASRVA